MKVVPVYGEDNITLLMQLGNGNVILVLALEEELHAPEFGVDFLIVLQHKPESANLIRFVNTHTNNLSKYFCILY